MKILVIFLLILIPNTCFAQEDFWGNELRDGDEVSVLNHEHIKGEYVEYSDGTSMVRFENGDYEDFSDRDYEQR